MSKEKKKRNPNRTQAAVVGPPGLFAFGGRTLLVTKPSGADLLSMSKWISDEFSKIETKKGISSDELKGLTPEQQAMLLREYVKSRNSKRTPTEAEAFDILMTPEGVALQVYFSARRHQSITLEDIRPLVTEANHLQVYEDLDNAVAAALDEVEEDDPKASGGENCSSASSVPPDSPLPK
jgi:hypothetical protein